MPVADLCEELTQNFSLPQEKVNSFQDYIRERYKVATAGDLQKLRASAFDSAVNEAGLNGPETVAIRICLGCALNPFEFPPDPSVASDDADSDDDEPLANWISKKTPSAGLPEGDQVEKAHVVKQAKKKGGSLKEAAQVLTLRREHLDPLAYNLPIPFQDEMRGNPLRNEERLRKKIVQEIEAVCGDLYPSLDERTVILAKVEKECGPPTSTRAPHWDNWKDAVGKKHKGTTIGDLERARQDPSKFGVTGKAWNGMMRPARPFVPRQGASVLEPGGAMGLDAATPVPTSTPQENPAVDRHEQLYGAEDFSDLSEEKVLQGKVKALEDELAKVKAAEEAKKKEKEEAKKADREKRAAEKAAKRLASDAAKENGGNNPTGKKHKGSGKAVVPEMSVETAAVETPANEAYLSLLEKAFAAGLEIMEDKMVALINDKDGVPSRCGNSDLPSSYQMPIG